jgi:hypothetical protein
LGWNTYDSWPAGINQTAFLANVQVLQAKLLQYGWEYAVVVCQEGMAERMRGEKKETEERAARHNISY